MSKLKHKQINYIVHFVERSQDEVKKLIAGPSVYICNECVDLCNDIIEEESKNDEESPYDQHCITS